MQIWEGDKDLAVETARTIREKLPNSKIGILANACQHPKDIEQYVDLIHKTKEDLHLAGGIALHELLVLGLRMSGTYILKVEPDCIFGVPAENLEETLLNMPAGIHGYHNVLGSADSVETKQGYFGLDRATARRIVDEGILLSPSILNPDKQFQLKRKRFVARNGQGAHSWPLALVCNKLKIKHYDSPELRNFITHPPIKSVFKDDLKSQLMRLDKSELRGEIIASSPEEIGLSIATDFVSRIWGPSGISISQKYDPNNRSYIGNFLESDGVLKHSSPAYTDIASANKVIRTGVFSHRIMNCKPIDENGVAMVVLDVDRRIEDCDASVVSTSFDHSQIFFMMKDPLSDELAEALIKEASFADKKGSRLMTFLVGVRIAGTASYEEVCLQNQHSDKCTAHKVLADDKVRLVKFVDKFFTYDEALAVIRGLAESYKVRPPVTEPEPALP